MTQLPFHGLATAGSRSPFGGTRNPPMLCWNIFHLLQWLRLQTLRGWIFPSDLDLESCFGSPSHDAPGTCGWELFFCCGALGTSGVDLLGQNFAQIMGNKLQGTWIILDLPWSTPLSCVTASFQFEERRHQSLMDASNECVCQCVRILHVSMTGSKSEAKWSQENRWHWSDMTSVCGSNSESVALSKHEGYSPAIKHG